MTNYQEEYILRKAERILREDRHIFFSQLINPRINKKLVPVDKKLDVGLVINGYNLDEVNLVKLPLIKKPIAVDEMCYHAFSWLFSPLIKFTKNPSNCINQANLKDAINLVPGIQRTRDALKLFKVFLQRNGCVQKKKYIAGKNGSAVVFTGCLFENDALNFKTKARTLDFTTFIKITGCKNNFIKESSLKIALRRAGLAFCRKNVNLLKDYLIKLGCCQKKKKLSSFVGEKGFANCFTGCLFLDEVLNLQEKPNLLNFSTVVKITGCKNNFIKGSSLKIALRRVGLPFCRKNVNLLKDYLIKLGCCQKKKKLSSFVGEKGSANCFTGCLFLDEVLNLQKKPNLLNFSTVVKITGCKNNFIKGSSLKIALRRAGLASCRQNVNLLKDHLIKLGCCQKKKRLSSFVGKKEFVNCFIGCLFLNESLNFLEKSR
jgi:hypothetical protein